MTIIHKGIRRKTTDVLDDYGQAYYAQNWRFRRLGEVGRRPGIGKSNMARLTGPVRSMICGNLFFPYLVQVNDAGDVEATLSPSARWGDPIMDIPDGGAGQPSAPVINSVTFSPALPVSGSDQSITMTINYTYDGLSGPISVLQASNLNDGLGNEISVNAVAGTVVTYFLEAADPAGVYTTGLPPDGILLEAGPFTSNLFTPTLVVA